MFFGPIAAVFELPALFESGMGAGKNFVRVKGIEMMSVDIVSVQAADMNVLEARELTDRIRSAIESVDSLIVQAYKSRAWAALGYSSWDDYCDHEFGSSRVRVPREERAERIASLRESGLSIRAIAAATGDGYGTISRELAGDPNGSPEPITGTDGKTYAPKPRPIVDHNAEPEPAPLPPGFRPGDLDALNVNAPASESSARKFGEPSTAKKKPKEIQPMDEVFQSEFVKFLHEGLRRERLGTYTPTVISHIKRIIEEAQAELERHTQ